MRFQYQYTSERGSLWKSDTERIWLKCQCTNKLTFTAFLQKTKRLDNGGLEVTDMGEFEVFGTSLMSYSQGLREVDLAIKEINWDKKYVVIWIESDCLI